MKFIIIFAAVMVVALTAPTDEGDAQDLRFGNDNPGVEGVDIMDQIKNNIPSGTFTYIGPDGQVYIVNNVADENGFQRQG